MVNLPIDLIFIGLYREQPTRKIFALILSIFVVFQWTVIFVELTMKPRLGS